MEKDWGSAGPDSTGGKGTPLGMHKNMLAWHKEWQQNERRRLDIDNQFVEIFTDLIHTVPEMRQKIERMLRWMLKMGYAELGESEETGDKGEGTSTGKREVQRKVSEEQEEAEDIEVLEEDVEGSEMEMEEEVVEVVGKGKGKSTEQRAEEDESTLE